MSDVYLLREDAAQPIQRAGGSVLRMADTAFLRGDKVRFVDDREMPAEIAGVLSAGLVYTVFGLDRCERDADGQLLVKLDEELGVWLARRFVLVVRRARKRVRVDAGPPF